MQDIEKKDIIVDVADEKVEIIETAEDKKDIKDDATVEVKNTVIDETKESTIVDEVKEVEIKHEDNKEDTIEVEVKSGKIEDKVEDSKKSKKKDKKKKDKVDTAVVEVSNIPTEVVSTKEQKKKNKVASFFAFTTIILALVFTIVDWTVESVTKNHNPQIVLHLMDWISIMLYITLAVKALPFLAGKKKWVKVLFWICVIATLVCIIVPMVLDYVDLANAIQKAQQEKEAAKETAKAIMMLV